MEKRLKELKKRRSELNREYMTVCSEIEEIEKKLFIQKINNLKSLIGKYIKFSWSIPEGECGEVFAYITDISPVGDQFLSKVSKITIKGKIAFITQGCSEIIYKSDYIIEDENYVEITKEEFDKIWQQI